MYRPRRINIILKTNLGITSFRPNRDNRDVTIIGPKNQARGTLKYSAIIAAGTENIITKINSFEKISLKFSLLIGIEWLFCIYYEYRIFRFRAYYIFNY